MTRPKLKSLRGKLVSWKGRGLRIRDAYDGPGGRTLLLAFNLETGVECMPFLDEVEL